MLFRFEGVELDEKAFELRRDGCAVPVQRRVLDTLLFLARRPNRLVTKDDLIAGPWGGVAVTDAALSQVIMAARRVLGEAGDRCITTVRGKGFRFTTTVQVLEGSSCDASDGDNSTIPEGPLPADSSGLPSPPDALALIVAWCQDEPHRLGQAIVVAPGSPGAVRLFGRGDASPDDPYPRTRLFELRPGLVRPAPLLTNRKISRVQFFVQSLDGDNVLEIQNLGRCPLLQDDREVTQARLRPGETVRLGSQMLFVCVKRPSWIPRMCGTYAPFPFGSADEDGLVGESPAMWLLRSNIRRVAARKSHVRLSGGSPEERELVANAIHAHSPWSCRPFVVASGSRQRMARSNWPEGATVFLSASSPLLPLAWDRPGRIILSSERGLRSPVSRPSIQIDLPEINTRREDLPLLINHLAQSLTGPRLPNLGHSLAFVEDALRDAGVCPATLRERLGASPSLIAGATELRILPGGPRSEDEAPLRS